MTTPSPYGQPEYPDAGQQPGYPAGQQPGYPGAGQQPGYPGAGYAQPGYGTGVAPKSKTTAALLAFFLGDFGAHNFYRGQKGRAFGHLGLLLLGVVLFGIAGAALVGSVDARGNVADSAAAGVGIVGVLGYLVFIANGIWRLVEFIMILVSKDGTLQ